ncbi:MAG: energy transducer TonB [Myxococcales bacterium]|nr:energy transducer TonB [Myxococcales bacterium]
MIFARYLLSTAMALGVTFGVFYGMQSLVVQTDAALDKPQSGGVIDFVRVKRESLPEPKKRELPDKPRSVDEPPPPQMQMKSSEGGAAVAAAMAIQAPTPKAEVKLRGGPKLGAAPVSDSSAIPLVRINPQYPRSARQARIEGWVKVRFDVGPTGKVENPVVLDAQPKGVFESAALAAFRRWKYRPKVVSGQPVVQRGQVTKILFKLDD